MNRRLELRNHLETEELRRQAKKKDKKDRQRAIQPAKAAVPLPLPSFTVSHAVAAGLSEEAALALVNSFETFGSGLALRSANGDVRAERLKTKAICLDVLGVVGLGEVDKLVLNHNIRNVISRLLDEQGSRSGDTTKLADRIIRLISLESFETKALDALYRHVQDSKTSSSARRQPVSEHGIEITRQWISDGGWRPYCFALDVVKHVAGHIQMDSGVGVSLDTALGYALGYITNSPRLRF